jgi:hypothetical protein
LILLANFYAEARALRMLKLFRQALDLVSWLSAPADHSGQMTSPGAVAHDADPPLDLLAGHDVAAQPLQQNLYPRCTPIRGHGVDQATLIPSPSAPASRPCLCPRDPRYGRQRGSACGQMQKISAGKFHFEPRFTSHPGFCDELSSLDSPGP